MEAAARWLRVCLQGKYAPAYFSGLVGDSSGCLNSPGSAYLNRSFFSPVFSRLPSVA